MKFNIAYLLTTLAVTANGANIMIEDFGTDSTSVSHFWEERNDPVMGGVSNGSFTILKEEGRALFQGQVAIVPFLRAPGFIKAETSRGDTRWPDISSCTGIELNVLSRVEYDGYRISFGKNHPWDAMRYLHGYKSDIKFDKINEEVKIQIPFKDFTDKWDAGTGDALITCQEDEQFCPDQDTLHKGGLYSIAMWGEGVEGTVDMDIYSIQGYGCDENAANNDDSHTPPPEPATIAPNNNDTIEPNTAGPDEITIENFASPVNQWRAMNDPVMGGQSYSTVKVEDGIAKFDGECKIVPFLRAPGFITMVTGGFRSSFPTTFPNVSSCSGLKVVMRSSKTGEEDDYTGYRVSFGTHHEADGRYAMGYKAPAFSVKTGDFDDYIFPFNTFSAKWDDATGDIKVPCSSRNPELCPDQSTLQNLQTMSFWGEGVEGTVALEIKSISAVGCNGSSDSDSDSSSSETTTTTPAPTVATTPAPTVATTPVPTPKVTAATKTFEFTKPPVMKKVYVPTAYYTPSSSSSSGSTSSSSSSSSSDSNKGTGKVIIVGVLVASIAFITIGLVAKQKYNINFPNFGRMNNYRPRREINLASGGNYNMLDGIQMEMI